MPPNPDLGAGKQKVRFARIWEGTDRMKFEEKRSKNSNFLQQSVFRNAVNISVLAFVGLLQRKMQKLEFAGIYMVLCK